MQIKYKPYKYRLWPHSTFQLHCLLLWKQIMPLFHSDPFSGSPANSKLKPKSFMMAWRAPQNMALICSVPSFSTTPYHQILWPPWPPYWSLNMLVCLCLRDFELAVLSSLTDVLQNSTGLTPSPPLSLCLNITSSLKPAWIVTLSHFSPCT